MVIAWPLVDGYPVTTQVKKNPSKAPQSNKKGVEDPFLKYQTYSFTSTIEGQFKTEKQMLDIYGKLKEQAITKTQKQSK